MRKSVLLLLGSLLTTGFITGCGDSKVDNKQPTLQGTPDPRLKGVGPAPVGQPGGGGPAKGGVQPGAN